MPAFASHPSLAPRLIPGPAFLAQAEPHYTTLVVGTAIFRPPSDAPLQLLLVQRAAHEHFLPNAYELPGGHVEDTDTTLLHAAAREVLEETGLTISAFLGEIPPFQYSSGPGKTTLQLNFVATAGSRDAAQLNVVVDPQEHQAYAWVSKDDLNGYDLSSTMRKTVLDALEWGEKNREMVS